MTLDDFTLEEQATRERAAHAQRHEEGIVAATAALIFCLGMLVSVFWVVAG